MHTCITTFMRSLICACMRKYKDACKHTYIRTYIHTYIHACMHACIHTYIHTYIHKYIHAYIHELTSVVDLDSAVEILSYVTGGSAAVANESEN